MKTIIQLNYNWFTSPGYGAEFISAIVGVKNVTRIEEHPAAGEGDKWYYDIHHSDGTMCRVFNPNQVFYSKEE